MPRTVWTTNSQDWSDWRTVTPKPKPKRKRPQGLEWFGVAFWVAVIVTLAPVYLIAYIALAIGLDKDYRDA